MALTNPFIRELGIQDVDRMDLRRADPWILRLVGQEDRMVHEAERVFHAGFRRLAVCRSADTWKFRETKRRGIHEWLGRDPAFRDTHLFRDLGAGGRAAATIEERRNARGAPGLPGQVVTTVAREPHPSHYVPRSSTNKGWPTYIVPTDRPFRPWAMPARFLLRKLECRYGGSSVIPPGDPGNRSREFD